MIKRLITAQDVCDLMNDLLQLDRSCVNEMIKTRFRCNQDTADHPTVQVRKYPEDEYFTVGLIGILNGLFGIREDGFGGLCYECDEDGNVIKFKPTPPPKKEKTNG